jgi:alkanesulfonate monooxygenase SsuD/methylene tetrahydromethanopterin reductase-like flavin-dependent oxidoreductase (luciferase family)
MTNEREISNTPLAVLDLVQIASGGTVAEGVRNSIDLAQRAEALGYQRYWFAEHHLNPGVVGAAPALTISLVVGATKHIRLGSAGVQLGHRTPLSTVEEFGLLDAIYPGRLDLGIGRSIGRPKPPEDANGNDPSLTGAAIANYRSNQGGGEHTDEERAANGLLIPKRFDFRKLLGSPRLTLTLSLLQQPGAYTPRFADQINDLLGLLHGTYRSPDGLEAHASPGEGAAVQLWILGSSGGESADVAGKNSLRFAASYHHSPSTVLDAVEAYRAAFVPSEELPRPHISVSADVVVADTDAEAIRLASGYGLWVRSIRSGSGAIRFPTPEEAASHVWSDDDRAVVQDRIDTQLVGSPQTVADRLEQLREATGADELAITTMTHRHEDRVRSYELLAHEWSRRQPATLHGAAAR